MIVKIFKTNQIYIFAFVFVALLVLRAPSVYNLAPLSISGYLPAIEWLFNFLNSWPVLSYLIGVVLILIQGIIISRIADDNQLFDQYSNLPALILAILYSMTFQLNWLSPAMIASTFLVFALKQIISIFNQKNVNAAVFRSGILIGLATFFYVPSIGMLLILFYNLSIFRSFHWKEYTMAILGIMSVYFYMLSYYLLTDQFELLLSNVFRHELYYTLLYTDWTQWTLYGSYILLTIFSYVALLNSISQRSIRTNNIYKVLSFFLFTPILFAAIFYTDLLSMLALILPPLSIVVSKFLLNIWKKWIGEVIVYMILGLIIFREVNAILN